MKKSVFRLTAIAILAVFPAQMGAFAQISDSHALDARLQDATLRLEYAFCGSDSSSEIYLQDVCSLPRWAGRRVNLDALPLKGNGQLRMTDRETGNTLYMMSFSTLFQEWQATEEATRIRKSFENVFLVPMPSVSVDITVSLYDFKAREVASLTHPFEPGDILIRPVEDPGYESRYLLRSGSAKDCIDVAILAEGYTAAEKETFFSDAQATVDAILAHEPFAALQDRFNFIAVAAISEDGGVSIPREGIWKDTVVGSHYDTFYTERYLTTPNVQAIHDALAGVPYEHVIILANCDTYGGGGIYNSYTLTTAHHKLFKQVVVHEFGHSFGGLADEYFYDDQYVDYYCPEVEPWEQNITTMADFPSKWQDMVRSQEAGIYEGGGYMSKGVWRSSEDCRMRTNDAKEFCPVCRRAIERMIRFYTEEK